jgi:hypothetical protein
MKKHAIVAVAIMLLLMIAAGLVYLKPAFIGKAILGTRLVILTTSDTACNITLKEGWNLVSFPCISTQLDRDLFLMNFTLSSIRAYDASDTVDPWKSYNPSLPSYVVQDLDTISKSKGYWMHSYNDTIFYRNGSLTKPTFISLKKGWNLIGMPNVTTINTYDAFVSIIPYFDYVFLYNASDDDWKEWTWNSSLPSDQDLNVTMNDYGYWIYMLNDSSLPVR